MKYYLSTQYHEYSKQPKCLGFKIGKPIQTIELISIGIVGEDDRKYYTISKDFDIDAAWNDWRLDKISDEQIEISKIKARRKGGFTQHIGYPKGSYWLRENVLKPIFDDLWKGNIFTNNGNANTFDYIKSTDFTLKNFKYLINKYGKTNKQIAEEIIYFTWKKKLSNNPLQIESHPMPIEFYANYADYDWIVFCQLFNDNLPKGFPKYCISLKQERDRIANSFVGKDVTEAPEGEPEYVIKDIKFEQVIENFKKNFRYPKSLDDHKALSKAKWNKELHKFINTLNG